MATITEQQRQELLKKFPEGSLIRVGEGQVAEVVAGGLRGIEREDDPRFLELGSFGKSAQVEQSVFDILAGKDVLDTQPEDVDVQPVAGGGVVTPPSPEGEFIQVAGTQQRFQISPEGGVTGFGTEEEFTRAGGQFGKERPVTAAEFRELALKGGVAEKTITEIIGPPEEQTDTAQDIKGTFKRKTAAENLSELEQAISDALGIVGEEEDVTRLEEEIGTFFEKRKTFEQILKEEFQRRGLEEKNELLRDLDKTIKTQRDILKDLPEDIQRSLEDVGVTQAQLNRVVAKESQKPLEVLVDLMGERNALASEINVATSFAEKFAGTRMEDQAVRLVALEWQLGREEKDVAKLDEKKLMFMQFALDERKQVMELALANPAADIDTNQDSVESAINKIRELPIPEEGELRTIGNQLVRVLPDGTTEVIFQGIEDQFSVPFFLEGVGTVQTDLRTGNIKVLRAIPAPGAPKGPSTSQFQAAQFAGRLVQATNILDALEPQILKMSATELAIQRNLPNRLKSDVIKSLEQAERNFVNSLLRRESGAAIAPSEFESAEKQYFLRPGEGRALRDQKRANRELVEQALINEAGAAFTQLQQTLFESLAPTEVSEEDKAVVETQTQATEQGVNLSDNLFFNIFSETK